MSKDPSLEHTWLALDMQILAITMSLCMCECHALLLAASWMGIGKGSVRWVGESGVYVIQGWPDHESICVSTTAVVGIVYA